MSENLKDIVDTACTLHSKSIGSCKFPPTNPPAVVEERDKDIVGPKDQALANVLIDILRYSNVINTKPNKKTIKIFNLS